MLSGILFILVGAAFVLPALDARNRLNSHDDMELRLVIVGGVLIACGFGTMLYRLWRRRFAKLPLPVLLAQLPFLVLAIFSAAGISKGFLFADKQYLPCLVGLPVGVISCWLLSSGRRWVWHGVLWLSMLVTGLTLLISMVFNVIDWHNMPPFDDHHEIIILAALTCGYALLVASTWRLPHNRQFYTPAANIPTEPRRYQFRLRTLLIGTAIIAIGCGIWTNSIQPYRDQHQAMLRLQQCVLVTGDQKPSFVFDWFVGGPVSDLYAIEMFGNGVRTDVDEVLCEELPRLKEVYSIKITNVNWTPRLIDAISRATHVEHLELIGDGLTDQDLQRLECLKTVKYLRIRSGDLTDDGLKAIQNAEHLISLYVSSNQVTGAGLAPLQSCKELLKLDVIGASLNDDLLSAAEHFPALACFSIYGGTFTAAGFEKLAHCERLFDLSLSGVSANDQNIEAISKIQNLQSLFIQKSTLTDAACPHLARLTNLESLMLDQAQITDAGLQHLTPLAKLKTIGIPGSKITSAAIPTLLQFADLQSLDATGTGLRQKDFKPLIAKGNFFVDCDPDVISDDDSSAPTDPPAPVPTPVSQ